jgi:PAS domain S-box-containing protein
MAAKDDEDERLRAVALRNAQSILLARRRAEEELRRQTEWLRVTLASIGDAVISTDAEDRITFLNGVAEALTGWTLAEARGRPLLEVFNIVNDRTRRPAENPALRARRDGLIAGLANHTVLIARDGTERPIDDSAAPMRDEAGAVIGAVLVFRDVSERKRAEENRARLAAIIESSEDAIVSKTLDGVILSWNAGAERLFGYAAVEAVGQPVTLIIPPERLGEEHIILNKLRRGERVQHFETVRVAKDGRLLDISLTVSPIHDDEGRIIGASKVARDITGQKKAENALRESEARYRAIVEATPECVELISRDGTLLQINPAGLAMIEATESEAVGKCVYDLVAPEHRDTYRALNERVCRGEGGKLEFDIIGLKGTHRHMETTAVPLATPDGGFNHLAVTRDVTERAAAARVLAESRARLDYAVRLSGVGFWYCDLPFVELIWDWRVKEHFWHPPEGRVTLKIFYDCLHPDDREPTRRAINSSIRDRVPYDVDYRTVNPATGATKWVHALGGTTYAADGTPTRFDGVTLDITAQKVNEARLARAFAREQEQGHLLRQAAEAALTIHSAGTLDSVLRVVAEEAVRIIGAHQAVSSLTVGDDWSQSINTVVLSDKYANWRGYDARPTGAGVYSLVCQTDRPLRLTQAELEAHPAWRNLSGEEGRHPPLQGLLAAPFVSRGGKNLGVIQLSDKREGDFTESDEAVLVQLAHIASVAIENARLYGELREQDRRKDEFLALLAHELRNPLAPLSNGLQVMRLAGTDAAALSQPRAMMERQLAHMVRLVDDLLDVSRITLGKMELRRNRIALADAVASALETARPLIDAAGHTLSVELPAEPVLIDGDVTRLAQVFANLLSNSARYTAHGGRISLTAERQGGSALVRVRDNGIGIPAESLGSIFDMFSQVDRSIERSTGGLGIGLALVKGVVEMHGGSVVAESPGPGKGSTFTVRLPVLASAGAFGPGTAADQAPRAGSSKRRVLVVDDHRDSAASMAMMLELMGDEVRIVHDGIEAVETARTYRPEVILMDVGMPRLNGYEATRRIREQPGAKEIVIVALTGWGQDEDRARSQEAGCNGHLVKPVSLPDLEKLLNSLRKDVVAGGPAGRH